MSQQEEKTSDMEHNEIKDLRRSIRRRGKPLEYWRGERIKNLKSGQTGAMKWQALILAFLLATGFMFFM
jgi:hypothetical protein